MRHLNANGFAERRTAAAEAKRQLLAKFASAPKATDPEMQERLAAREAVAVARGALKEALKAAENERLLAEAAAATAAAEIDERKAAEARQAEIADHASRAAADEAARKAKRDRRYAARKARQA